MSIVYLVIMHLYFLEGHFTEKYLLYDSKLLQNTNYMMFLF